MAILFEAGEALTRESVDTSPGVDVIQVLSRPYFLDQDGEVKKRLEHFLGED